VAAACTQKTSMKQGRCKAIFRGLVRERTYRSYRHTLLRQEGLLHREVSVALDEQYKKKYLLAACAGQHTEGLWHLLFDLVFDNLVRSND
jgi:hypothetical protein